MSPSRLCSYVHFSSGTCVTPINFQQKRADFLPHWVFFVFDKLRLTFSYMERVNNVL